MYLDILQMKRVHPMSHINYSDQKNHAQSGLVLGLKLNRMESIGT